MRALSLRQPWAHAILYLGKRIENRKKQTHYRGPLLLHVSQECTLAEYVWAVDWMTRAGVISNGKDIPNRKDLPMGGVVGKMTIASVVPPFSTTYPEGLDNRWHMREQFGYVLCDVGEVPFAPCKGNLGIYHLPDKTIKTSRYQPVSQKKITASIHVGVCSVYGCSVPSDS